MMEGKKISFGFTKTKKVEKPVLVERKEYIECLEEKSIKVVGGETVKEEVPLVITMKPNTLITAERLKQIAEEVEKTEAEPANNKIDGNRALNDNQATENETLDQMAERELLNEAKQEKKVDGSALTVSVLTLPVLDGQKESTLEDYEAIPVQEFGMAMLRGMGWTASKEQQFKHKQPDLRPKGLGLGADKVVKQNQKKNVSKDKDENLSIIKNAFVKITTGKYSGCYGKVVSLEDDNGRVMVEISIKKETVSLSEFMMQAVTKSEFDKQSKIINADSYEEYKKNEKSQKGSSSHEPQILSDKEASSSQRSNEYKAKKYDDNRSRRDENSSNGRNKVQEQRHRGRSSSNDDSSRHRKKRNKKYSSNDSLSSLSDPDRRRKKHRTEKKRYSSEESDSSDDKHRRERRKKSSPEKKRDIDKKRKGKKKKRDRDRSPNYKKHRK